MARGYRDRIDVCVEVEVSDVLSEISNEQILDECEARNINRAEGCVWDSDLEELDAAVDAHNWGAARTILDRYKRTQDKRRLEAITRAYKEAFR